MMMMHDLERLIWAGAVLLLYTMFCGLVWWRRSRGRITQTTGRRGATHLIAYASQTGFAEYLAQQTAQAMGTKQELRLLSFDDLTLADLQAAQQVLFIVSTTGEGDAPDCAARFMRQMAQAAQLDHVRYALLALGDRAYADYCGFGHHLDRWLKQSQAIPLFDVLELDNGDPETLKQWQDQLRQLGAVTADTAWQGPDFDAWMLAQRQQLNPDSSGSPAFHIALRPRFEGAMWQAGDIAEIVPCNSAAAIETFLEKNGLSARDDLLLALQSRQLPDGNGESLHGQTTEAVLAGLKPLPVRDYSIASLPQDGQIELLVREHHRPDGALGIGSGWLISHLPLGQDVNLRIRVNRNFHAEESDYPMILIGNGTGMAGLRAHLKQREILKRTRNWLIFGERNAAQDMFYREDLERWQDTGFLPELDLVFSRDQRERIYVQDRLRARAQLLRSWLDMGARIYVCGSLDGMAAGVDAALGEILGEDGVEALLNQRRYRRDVY